MFVMCLMLLTACGSEGDTYPMGTPTATPNPGEIALQMVQQQMAAEATQQVVGLQFTATAQVIGQTATSQFVGTQAAVTQQARVDAQATSDRARLDAQATSEQGRRDAQATQQRMDVEATQAQAQRVMIAQATQARMDLESTQQAEATAAAWKVTEMVIPTHNLWTQQAVEQNIIIATNEVELSNLAVQQARDTNQIKWQIPLLFAVVVLLGGVLWIWRESRWKVIKDDDGQVQGFGFNEQFVNPRLLPGAVLDFRTTSVPLLTDAVTQKEIVVNEQKIRAIEAIPVNPSAGGAQAFNMAFGDVKRDEPFEIVDSVPTELLDDEGMKAADSDWRKANE
jgi:hypothetical protein